MKRISLVAALAAAAPAAAMAQGHVLDNGHVHVDIADPADGTTANANRFDSVTWTGPNGTTGNLAASSGGNGAVCNDPYETFGEARGDYAEEPRFIVAGTKAKWKAKAGQTLNAKTATKPKTCKGVVIAGTAASLYKLTTAAGTENLLAVTRTFTFNGSGSGSNGDLRAFMPRLPDSTYDVVYVPDSTGAVQTYSALACDSICQVTDWNGKWLADDDGSGNGVMVIRSAASTLPALVDVDHDGASDSNVSAIALTPPGGGWSGKIVESEYLCFYDAATWTPAMRAKGKPPTGCAVKGF